MRWATPRRVRGAQCFAWHARCLAALGRGDVEEAYRSAVAIGRPGEFEPHTAYVLLILLDLVESAVRSGHLPEAREHVAAMHDADLARLSGRLRLVVAGCTAPVSDESCPVDLFDAAVGTPGADDWPFELRGSGWPTASGSGARVGCTRPASS